mmetsp:Transcript_32969/g.61773  ORF Transcript_32969/g.61773 Transcript_32969/m.61773 type:complete len:245 (-) Transcript_32969:13-747(-)
MATDPGPWLGNGSGAQNGRDRSRSPQGCGKGTAGSPGAGPGGLAPLDGQVSGGSGGPCGLCMGPCPGGPCMVNPMMQMQQMQMMQMQQMQQMVGMGMMMGNMFNMMGGGMPPVPGVPAAAFDPTSMIGAGKIEDEEEEEVDIPAGPSSTVGHPNYRPPDADQIPGVTDKRFEGKIRLWWDSKGHGLIECEEVRLKFPGQDGVFLHDSQRRHFKKGDEVTFAVFVNFRGRPQATELRRLKRDEKS